MTSYIFIRTHCLNICKGSINDYKHIFKTWLHRIDSVVIYILNSLKSSSRNLIFKDNSLVVDIPFCADVGSLLGTT